jgi:membrane protein DedA with SNARE-associated domain
VQEIASFLIEHGYGVVFAWMLAEQLGLPIPSIPLLLAAGALAGIERLSLGWTVLLAMGACLIADLIWYQLGRRRGAKVLGWLCRISLEPDSCVRRTENAFAQHGKRSLLLAKFVPGLNTMAPPMAGMTGMPLGKFLLFDTLGSTLFTAGFAILGFAFRNQIESLALYAARLGGTLFWLLLGGLAVYVGRKYRERRRFLRGITVARIPAEELKKRLESGEEITILDLRHPLDFLVYPQTIDSAIRIAPDEIEARKEEIPRDRDVVLYCT